jgi:hypothetical protein
MKPKYEVTHCECCSKMIVLQLPPPLEQYEQGRIHITAGTILLPDRVVSKNSIWKNTCMDISGYYCNFACLTTHLQYILR